MHAKDVYGELTKIVNLDENASFVYILATACLIQECLIFINLVVPSFVETENSIKKIFQVESKSNCNKCEIL